MAEASTFGGVSLDEIGEFAKAEGIPGAAGGSLPTKFARRVSNLITLRCAKGESGSYSVFLLSEDLAGSKDLCDHIEQPLLDHGNDPVGDHVFVTSVALTSAFQLEVEWGSIDELFDLIVDKSLGELPAIVVDWRGERPIGKFYRDGLVKRELAYAIHFDELPISTEAIWEALKNFREKIKTPSISTEAHGTRIWSDAGKGIPESRPEERIQGRLVDALAAVFCNYNVRAELVTEEGRADVSIHRQTLSAAGVTAFVCEWLLELKALCDMTSSGKKSTADHEQAIEDGLYQAIAYKSNLGALKGALCCFDMRKTDSGDDSCFGHIKDVANENEILLWRGFLFRSAKAARNTRKLSANGTA